DELEEEQRALAERAAELERRENELAAGARSESERVSELIAARSAELEQREAAIKDREEGLAKRERRLARAAQATVSALLGEQADDSQPTREPEQRPELTFSEGIQALA